MDNWPVLLAALGRPLCWRKRILFVDLVWDSVRTNKKKKKFGLGFGKDQQKRSFVLISLSIWFGIDCPTQPKQQSGMTSISAFGRWRIGGLEDWRIVEFDADQKVAQSLLAVFLLAVVRL